MSLISFFIVGMIAVAVLGGVVSVIAPDSVNWLRQLWTILTPPPM